MNESDRAQRCAMVCKPACLDGKRAASFRINPLLWRQVSCRLQRVAQHHGELAPRNFNGPMKRLFRVNAEDFLSRRVKPPHEALFIHPHNSERERLQKRSTTSFLDKN